MKQTILALGAAAALGFAGAAHAEAFFGVDPTAAATPDAAAAADTIEFNSGGVGHMLFMPYYNAQQGTNTYISITNTDNRAGKVVKVRLRGASNSDDVLDFTLLLSPNDMWVGTLTRDDGGLPVLRSGDKSCVIPVDGLNPGITLTDGLAARMPHVTDDNVLKTLASEGYIEILNMANIDPALDTKKNGSLYWDILHDAGVPLGATDYNRANGGGSCQSRGENAVDTYTFMSFLGMADSDSDGVSHFTGAQANAAGLQAPTGGLMGSWIVLNNTELSAYSGVMTAVRAVTSANGPNGWGNIIYSPQIGEDADLATSGIWDAQYQPTAGTASGVTADPLLVTATPVITPAWWDIPDMSTPLVPASNPLQQVVALGAQRTGLGHMEIYNEYLSDLGGSVPMTTDWVISQPTRRYYAAVEYKTGNLNHAQAIQRPDIIMHWNMATPVLDSVVARFNPHASFATAQPAAGNNAYRDLTLNTATAANGTDLGVFACLPNIQPRLWNREEGQQTAGGLGGFSPRNQAATSMCGEVVVMSFSSKSPMNAQVARLVYNAPFNEGWGRLRFGPRDTAPLQALPVVGFAATSILNQDLGQTYGATYTHRAND